jgi:hypothetical protein
VPTPDGFYSADELDWLLTFRFQVMGPYGSALQELTVEIPQLRDNGLATAKVGQMLWAFGVAPATSFLAMLYSYSCFVWPLKTYIKTENRRPAGMQFHLPSRLDKTPCVVMHTNGDDRYSRRRLFFPAAPARWMDSDGMLNAEGAEKMRQTLMGLYGGLSQSVTGAPTEWWIRYPAVIPTEFPGIKKDGFRRVHHLRLCQLTIPAPDFLLAE